MVPPSAEFTRQDNTTIEGFFEATPKYVWAGDWENWANQYAEDGILLPPNNPTIRGRDAILAWGKLFPEIEVFEFPDVRVWGEGNLAYATSAYRLKFKGLEEDTGKQLGVFRRDSNGVWKVMALSFSSDLAPNPVT